MYEGTLLRTKTWKLPTIQAHEKREAITESERREAAGTFMIEAARKRQLGRGAARMMDAPGVPPNATAYGQLRKLLPTDAAYDKPVLRARFRARGFHMPGNSIATLRQRLAVPGAIEELIRKWRTQATGMRY